MRAMLADAGSGAASTARASADTSHADLKMPNAFIGVTLPGVLISGSVSSVVAKLNRRQRRSVDLQRENIRPRIVTGHVEGTARARRRRRLDLAIEHGPVSIVRPRLDLPERPDNQRPSVTDPFIAVRKQPLPARKIAGYVRPLDRRAGG